MTLQAATGTIARNTLTRNLTCRQSALTASMLLEVSANLQAWRPAIVRPFTVPTTIGVMGLILRSVMSLKQRILKHRLSPNGPAYAVVFRLGRWLARLGVLEPERRIEVLNGDGFSIILTPLAGSSSVRAMAAGAGGRDYVIRDRTQPIYLLQRPDADRLLSFYNKKVRNPDELGKCLLLSCCPPLTHRSAEDDFIRYLADKRGSLDKDKHLYTRADVLRHFGLDAADVIPLSVVDDAATLASLLGTRVPPRRVNSTADKARFQVPGSFSAEQRQRIQALAS